MMITENMIKAGISAMKEAAILARRGPIVPMFTDTMVTAIYEAMSDKKNKDAIKEYQAYAENRDKLCTCVKQA